MQELWKKLIFEYIFQKVKKTMLNVDFINTMNNNI